MGKYTYANSSRRRIDYRKITMITLGLMILITGAVATHSYVIGKNIKDMEATKEAVQQTIKEVETEMTTLKEDNTLKEAELANIENILWRYEPVVIPESMQE